MRLILLGPPGAGKGTSPNGWFRSTESLRSPPETCCARPSGPGRRSASRPRTSWPRELVSDDIVVGIVSDGSTSRTPGRGRARRVSADALPKRRRSMGFWAKGPQTRRRDRLKVDEDILLDRIATRVREMEARARRSGLTTTRSLQNAPRRYRAQTAPLTLLREKGGTEDGRWHVRHRRGQCRHRPGAFGLKSAQKLLRRG